ncbi:MAG TPA: DNA repair protein RadA [Candidatus Dependentiae bacterium]|nr:DNA repair protein RadA [Candidatus Dependentiae bacterium]HRQ62232.1 DNA repair protein RadA [Candidatus Dependentiae bacterium]
MSKQKNSYTCTNCTYKTLKWLGCCPECKEWDSFFETKPTTITPIVGKAQLAGAATTTMLHLDNVPTHMQQRMLSGIHEWDRVMGGGIIPSSLLVLTGDPGIGKSTLLLQVCNQLAQQYRVFYFSTEESLQQVKLRAQRLGCLNAMLLFSDASDLATIIATAQSQKPTIMIIDSIQNCYIAGSQTLPGSVGQLRESTFQLMRLAKEQNITIILTGHITKDGVIAGPKTLEHMVDAVFYLQGEDRWQTRVLRAVKNRFGTINELGFFEMKEEGLQEVANINEHLLSEVSNAPGSVLVSVMEGSRPLLLELQALTIESKLAMPQRVISGVDHKQVMLIAAILQKYLHIKLNTHDIFFKISGSFKVKSSAIDLGIALALLSSYFQEPLPEKSIALGEISLTGQVKPINQINQFVREASTFGIEQLMIAKNQKIEHKIASTRRFHNIYELLSIFGNK